MFSVIFEVHPKSDKWDGYLGIAKMLRPELEQVDGFVENVRYKSLTRPGWLLSLSGWRDEKSVVRWRTAQRHHVAQERGRSEIMLDYHLRVGQITHDTQVPAGQTIAEQRLDETEIGEGTTVTFVDAKWPNGSIEPSDAPEVARHLGLNPRAGGLVTWEVFDAVLTPGDAILMMVWKSKGDAAAFAGSAKLRRAVGCGTSASCVTTACSIAGRRPNIIRRRPMADAELGFHSAIAQCARSLENLEACLRKAERYAHDRKFDVGVLMSGRLAPDMQPFVYQVQSACDYVKHAAGWLAGEAPPEHPDTETTVGEIRERISKTVAYVASVSPARYDAAAAQKIALPWAPGKVIAGEDYLLQVAIPNIYFHLAMAYAILRHYGVDVGKMDFLGPMNFVDA